MFFFYIDGDKTLLQILILGRRQQNQLRGVLQNGEGHPASQGHDNEQRRCQLRGVADCQVRTLSNSNVDVAHKISFLKLYFLLITQNC